MILELVQARGIKAWLDGRVPFQEWSYGDGEKPGEIAMCEDKPLLFKAVQEGEETYEILSILPDKPMEEITLNKSTFPTQLTVTLTDRKLNLRVTKVVVGGDTYDEEADEYGTKVRLVNGEDFFVDEISVYVRAE